MRNPLILLILIIIGATSHAEAAPTTERIVVPAPEISALPQFTETPPPPAANLKPTSDTTVTNVTFGVDSPPADLEKIPDCAGDVRNSAPSVGTGCKKLTSGRLDPIAPSDTKDKPAIPIADENCVTLLPRSEVNGIPACPMSPSLPNGDTDPAGWTFPGTIDNAITYAPRSLGDFKALGVVVNGQAQNAYYSASGSFAKDDFKNWEELCGFVRTRLVTTPVGEISRMCPQGGTTTLGHPWGIFYRTADYAVNFYDGFDGTPTSVQGESCEAFTIPCCLTPGPKIAWGLPATYIAELGGSNLFLLVAKWGLNYVQRFPTANYTLPADWFAQISPFKQPKEGDVPNSAQIQIKIDVVKAPTGEYERRSTRLPGGSWINGNWCRNREEM